MAIVGSANADDKVLPGMTCVKQGDGGTLQVDQWGKARNLNATQSLQVICPLVKDDAAWSVDTVQIRGLDGTTAMEIGCTAAATDATQDFIIWGTKVYSGAGAISNTGWYNLVIPTSSMPSIQNSGSSFVTCVIPPMQNGVASSIASVYWNET